MSSVHKLNHRSKGIGLVELMIAMVLGLILIAGVIEIYLSSKISYRTIEEMARLQENARYAMYQIQKELRMAGYSDCSPDITNHLNPAGTNYDDSLFNLNEAVGGWEYSLSSGTGPGSQFEITTLDPMGIAPGNWDDRDGSNLPTSLENQVISGTDVLTVKWLGSFEKVSVKSNNNINSVSINTNGANNIPQYSILLVTQDCNSADLFQKLNNANAATVTRGAGVSTNPGPGNVNPTVIFGGGRKWSTVYGPGAKFLTFHSNAYFIGQGETGIPTLYRTSFGSGSAATKEKIVEGIENMQILYGEDTDLTADGIANIYHPMNSVSDGERVVSVRISLLMRTIEMVSTEDDMKADYQMAGHSAATALQLNPINDRYLRYVFTSTIKLRNRGDL